MRCLPVTFSRSVVPQFTTRCTRFTRVYTFCYLRYTRGWLRYPRIFWIYRTHVFVHLVLGYYLRFGSPTFCTIIALRFTTFSYTLFFTVYRTFICWFGYAFAARCRLLPRWVVLPRCGSTRLRYVTVGFCCCARLPRVLLHGYRYLLRWLLLIYGCCWITLLGYVGLLLPLFILRTHPRYVVAALHFTLRCCTFTLRLRCVVHLLHTILFTIPILFSRYMVYAVAHVTVWDFTLLLTIYGCGCWLLIYGYVYVYIYVWFTRLYDLPTTLFFV